MAGVYNLDIKKAEILSGVSAFFVPGIFSGALRGCSGVEVCPVRRGGERPWREPGEGFPLLYIYLASFAWAARTCFLIMNKNPKRTARATAHEMIQLKTEPSGCVRPATM